MIFNPAAGRGRGGARRAERYRRLVARVLPDASFSLTTRAGEETELADRALASGVRLLVAGGGDGTWSAVAGRVLASGRSDVAFGVLPSGTGNDFGRNLGLAPDAPARAVRALASGRTRRIDVGLVETPCAPEASAGRMRPRHFLNVVGIGFDVAVIDAAARARLLRGAVLYKVAALGSLLRFRGADAAVEGDGGASHAGRHLMLTISNGSHFGGGFPIAPHARLDDGLLHACSILDASPLARLSLFARAGAGRHLGDPGVRLLADTAFRVSLPDPPRFEIDGEVYRSADPELELRLLPATLEVAVPGDGTNFA